MFRNKYYVFLFLFSVISISSFSQKIKWVNFYWEGDTVGNRYFEKACILIPTEIGNLPHRFSTQLDLGAINSMLYGNTIDPYLSTYKELQNKIDTSAFVWIQSEKNPLLKNINLKLDGVSFGNVDLALFKDYGDSLTIDSIKTKSVKHIGTIAPDLFQDKVLIIDYAHNRLAVTKTIPAKYYKATNFVDIILKEGRVKIPFEINGVVRYLLFDTGSSRYGLFTTKTNADQISTTENIVNDSICGYSWGEYDCSYGKTVRVPIKLGKESLFNTTVFYKNENYLENFFRSENLWGMTGNVFFLDKTVIIDYKNNKFGVYGK
ncbi:MAG: hypothetical protein HYX39_14280 [Bacteroidetes bacterium]|nr:hypothetical protein [Bacteroidota bacterium]